MGWLYISEVVLQEDKHGDRKNTQHCQHLLQVIAIPTACPLAEQALSPCLHTAQQHSRLQIPEKTLSSKTILTYLRICQDSNATLMWACKTVLFVIQVFQCCPCSCSSCCRPTKVAEQTIPDAVCTLRLTTKIQEEKQTSRIMIFPPDSVLLSITLAPGMSSSPPLREGTGHTIDLAPRDGWEEQDKETLPKQGPDYIQVNQENAVL